MNLATPQHTQTPSIKTAMWHFTKLVINLLMLAFLFSCSPENDTDHVENPDTLVKDVAKKGTLKQDSNFNSSDNKILQLEKTFTFDDYKVPLFNGKMAEPDFTGNPFASDKEYVDFIKTGCKENKINFAGHYTIIGRSCGAECSHIFIVDRINGRIFIDIKPDDGRYGYEYRKDSKLLIANSSLFVDDQFERYIDYWCKPEFYQWNGKDFSLIE
jgi:hypothetical protein